MLVGVKRHFMQKDPVWFKSGQRTQTDISQKSICQCPQHGWCLTSPWGDRHLRQDHAEHALSQVLFWPSFEDVATLSIPLGPSTASLSSVHGSTSSWGSDTRGLLDTPPLPWAHGIIQNTQVKCSGSPRKLTPLCWLYKLPPVVPACCDPVPKSSCVCDLPLLEDVSNNNSPSLIYPCLCCALRPQETK